MIKQVVLGLMVVSLAGCGGFHKAKRGAAKPASQPVYSAAVAPAPASVAGPVAAVPLAKPSARGPIQSACMASDRKARSRELCGCIQAVANDTLNSSQQQMAVSFYNDPHKAQEIRQSDRANHEIFWDAYRDYGDRARRICG